MKKFTCEIGQKFGYWEVIDNTPVVKSGHTYVLVRCKCGEEGLKCLSDLVSSRTTGCRKCKARDRGLKIKIGDKYKRWTVVDGPQYDNTKHLMWLAQCECGNKRWFSPNELTNPTRCFECVECAAKTRGAILAKDNGSCGDLKLTRHNKLKRSAEKRGYAFEVSIEYLWNLFQEQKQICAITGDYIPSIEEASLDRIDSSKGYIEGNVQWVTQQANLSKHIMTMEQLYEFCRKVLNHANQQPSQSLTTLEGSETNS